MLSARQIGSRRQELSVEVETRSFIFRTIKILKNERFLSMQTGALAAAGNVIHDRKFEANLVETTWLNQ